MRIESDIKRVRKLAQAKDGENWRFRDFLKNGDMSVEELDDIVQRICKDVAQQIDCSNCANCCREIFPMLSQEDVERLADNLGTPSSELIANHLALHEDGDGYIFQKSPCPFLRNNRCTVYNARPNDCRSFPHLHKKEFIFRLIQAVNNCQICPIVYNVFEHLKKKLWQDGGFR